MIATGENEKVEFKSTLRWNLAADKADKAIENSALKTIVAFLNTEGGTLFVGIKDDGNILGIEKDQFLNDDKYLLHFASLLNDRIGKHYIEHIEWGLREVKGKKILRVTCKPSPSPAFLKNNGEEFYVRNGPSSVQLSTSEVLEYSKKHFR
jgi:predicted HTH transcriptional regulator